MFNRINIIFVKTPTIIMLLNGSHIKCLTLALLGLMGYLGFGQSLNLGDIAFTAFNADGDDDFAFVTLVDIPANTTIWFTDNEWTGTSFNDTNEGELEWSHNSIIPAGTVIVIEGSVPSATLGSISGTNFNIGASNESILALLEEPLTILMPNPGFLSGIANDLSGSGTILSGTGLTVGINFIDFADDNDGYEYLGIRSGESSFSDYLPLLMNSSNFQVEISNGENIIPISDSAFTINTNPILTLSESSITGLNYIQGNGPSSPQSFEVSGSNLDGSNVNLFASVGFEISDSELGTYENTLTLSSYDGTVTEIWVWLESGLTFGPYSGEVTLTGGGAAQVDVSVSGDVTGQVIVQQDFDSSLPIWNYSNDVSFFDNGWGSGFYGIINSSFILPLDNSDFSGNILGENDLADDDGDGTNGAAIISFQPINISGYTNVELSFDYQFVNYNADDDEGSYEVFEDDTTQGQIFLADGSNPSTENTNGSDSINITSGTNEVSFNYVLENDGITAYSGLDNIILSGTANDTDTDILPPTNQVVVGDIIVDQAINVSTSVPVFKFDVEDIGGDGLVTEFTHIRVVPGANNTANWSEVIEGIRLQGDGNNVSQPDQLLTIEDDELIIEVTTNNGEMTIANGTSKEFTISVFINPDFAVEGEIIQMAIDNSNAHFFVNPSGSMISRNIAGFEGEEHTIVIQGNKLEFLVSPSTTIINKAMSTVQVAYTDDLGKVDTDFNALVSITSTGTLIGDPVSVAAVEGIASFSNLVHTSLGSNLTLTASSSGEADITSLNFDSIALPELFISEVADPNIVGGQGKFVELYNAGITPIDFDVENYYLVRESNGSGGLSFIKLVGTVEAKAYYVIGVESNFNSIYGFEADLKDSDSPPTISGNGNDSYFISRQNLNDNALKNSSIDIYGVIGLDGTGEDWEYTNGRASRKTPEVKNSNTSWTLSEWDIETYLGDANGVPGLSANDMTPGYGDNDYIYDNGNWNNNIFLNSNPNGVIQPNRNIFIKSGSVNFDLDIEIGDFIVRSGSTVTLAPNVKLTVTGDIVNEGTVIFESDDTSSTVLEPLADNTRVIGEGFEVHRRIPILPGVRSFRYLSLPVTTSTTINTNWQEGATSTTEDPNPGFGTHITGTILGSNLGFDATQTGNLSMFEFNPATQNWNSIPNTNAKTFNAGEAYAILVRGDRATDLSSNTAVGNSTTLRTTGELKIGGLTLDGSTLASQDFFTLVGNPYQSQVDLKMLINNSVNIDHHVYIYDPKIGDLGTTVTLDLSEETVSPTPASSANQYLQPNQAFFVKTIGTNPEINFTENTKDNSDSQTGVFNEPQDNNAILNISLKNANHELQDGIRIVYGDDYSNAVNYEDATKLWNSGETIAVESGGEYLSIEKREWPVASEITHLNFYNLTLSNYVISLDYQLNKANMLDVYLVDNYTGQNTLVSTTSLTDYSFLVDLNILESIASDRFHLSYNSTLSVNSSELESFAVYPNPSKTSDKLTIAANIQELQTIKSIELFNLQGQRLQTFNSFEIQNNSNSIQLNFNSTIIEGTYILKIMKKEINYICKLIFN